MVSLPVSVFIFVIEWSTLRESTMYENHSGLGIIVESGQTLSRREEVGRASASLVNSGRKLD
jgi:hypothetical protein